MSNAPNLRALAASQQQHLATLVETNASLIRATAEHQGVYASIWRKYRAFIDDPSNSNVFTSEDGKYLTRNNIDIFFQEVVAHTEIIPESARRYVSALQHYANQIKYINDNFTVDSGNPNLVANALEAQKARYMFRIAEQQNDPHANLPTAVISKAEYEKIHHRTILDQIDTLDFQWAFSTCNSCYLQYLSSYCLNLCDMRLDTAHGPPLDEEENRDEMLSYILQSGRHKDRAKHKQIVGAWRHRDYTRCSTGAASFMLIGRFHGRTEDMNFYKGAATGPMWMKKPILCDWYSGRTQQQYKNGYSKARRAYAKVFQDMGVTWAKVTHLRKSGMDAAGTTGVSSEMLGSMSKHTSGNKQTRYNPQLSDEVMQVMSGFKRGDLYDVPRTRLELPWTKEELANRLFPQRHIWIMQHHSDLGDKSVAASNFLFLTLPFLAKVAAQDGIYLIQDFPHHPVSRILLESIPAYDAWASCAQACIAEETESAEVRQVQALNAAAQAAFQNTNRRIQLSHSLFRKYHMEQMQLLQAIAWQQQHQNRLAPANLPARQLPALDIP